MCVLMENMKERTEIEKLRLEIVILKKRVAFNDGIIEGLVSE